MKMVAASKLKRARSQLDNASLYSAESSNLVSIISPPSLNQTEQNNGATYGHKAGSGSSYLIIMIAADRGLCGSFNQNIYKKTNLFIRQLESDGKSVKIMTIGKKSFDLMRSKHKKNIIASHEHLFGKAGLKFEQVKQIANSITDEFEDGSFDQCLVFYNKFKSAIEQLPSYQQLVVGSLNNSLTGDDPIGYEFEPSSRDDILQTILPLNLAAQLLHALIESNASEQAARMTAMENATRNCGEIIKKLNLVYNRTRQAYITKELIEIISGAEAAG